MAKKKKDAPSGTEWARDFGCEVLSVNDAVDVIVQAIIAGIPLVLVGDTGQGKSDAVFKAHAIVKRMAAEGKIPRELALPVSSPILRQAYELARRERREDPTTAEGVEYEFLSMVPATADAFDYRGLPAIRDDGETQYYTRPEDIPKDPHGWGIINVREMNRPAAARTVKPLIEMMESRMLGPHILPEGYRIIADLNVGDIYDVQDILTPFFNRRVAWIYVRNSAEDFIVYMRGKYTDSVVATFIEEHPEAFDNHEGRVNNQIYACAASWEKVHLITEALLEKNYRLKDMRPLISGIVRAEWAIKFLDYAKKGLALSPLRLLQDYGRYRDSVLTYLSDGHGADLVAAAATTCLRILKSKPATAPDLPTGLTNFTEFFCDLPMEVAQNTVLDLSTSVAQKLGEEAARHDPETLELIKEELMGHPEARERLNYLYRIISKEPAAPKGSKGRAKK